jgi:hypothetical protein
MTLLRACSLLAPIALAACGNIEPLTPPPGQPMPVKPLLARTTPTSAELLTPPVYASPERIDELIRRSEPRRPDRFDLPPAGGGIVPVPPYEEEPDDRAGLPTADDE